LFVQGEEYHGLTALHLAFSNDELAEVEFLFVRVRSTMG
jgi:hypothetical protein